MLTGRAVAFEVRVHIRRYGVMTAQTGVGDTSDDPQTMTLRLMIATKRRICVNQSYLYLARGERGLVAQQSCPYLYCSAAKAGTARVESRP